MEKAKIDMELQRAAELLKQRVAAAAEVVYLARTGSTNSWLKERFAAGGIDGPLVVFTGEQTAGRGTRGRDWSQVGGRDIALSVAAPLAGEGPVDRRLSLAVGVVAARAIELVTGIAARVKWPNDVLVPAGPAEAAPLLKASGTLIETAAAAAGRLLIAGVGINVNSTAAEFPAELAGRLATLHDSAGRTADRAALAAELGTVLLNLLVAVGTDGGSDLLERLTAEWLSRDATAGARYFLRRDGRDRPVVAMGVDPASLALVCRDQEGNRYEVASYTELLAPGET
ncbi:biotin--[acetyl-CoA-carboxylase] ligase [bacterium]|nr:biotin--[acetyl-CoA-carboxylase] ligase [bacterium]